MVQIRFRTETFRNTSALPGSQVIFRTIRNNVTVNKERAGSELLLHRKGNPGVHVFHSVIADRSRKVNSQFYNFPGEDVAPAVRNQ